jgi:ribosomal-protein-alanine N-acetyltransferase
MPDSSALQVPPLDASAAALCAALHAEAFAEPWSEASLRALLVQPHVDARLAVEAERPLGFILMRTALDEAEVLTLAVRPSARRRGVGAALLAAGEADARARGAGRLLLEVSERNVAALALYAAAGWRTIGTRPRYYADGAAARLMEKTARPPAC